jgi:hypothetical protein
VWEVADKDDTKDDDLDLDIDLDIKLDGGDDEEREDRLGLEVVAGPASSLLGWVPLAEK